VRGAVTADALEAASSPPTAAAAIDLPTTRTECHPSEYRTDDPRFIEPPGTRQKFTPLAPGSGVIPEHWPQATVA
jgi:hypothetical protein